MTTLGTVAIAGLGLVGGSLARDLASRGVRVLGCDADPDTILAALDECVVAEPLGPGLDGIEEADALVIALPVARAAALLESVAPRLRHLRLITDVGSTKGRITAAASRLGLGNPFVGAHPLTGGHRSGWGAARVGLFRGARVFLTPTADTDEEALTTARTLWESVGAGTELIEPELHDRVLAWISHLPQSVSTALALALAGEGIAPVALGPGGRDMTRLAASSPEVWTEIALENSVFLLPAINALAERLRELGAAIVERDARAVEAFFAGGRAWAGGE